MDTNSELSNYPPHPAYFTKNYPQHSTFIYIYIYVSYWEDPRDRQRDSGSFYTTLYHMTRCQGIVCLRDPIYFFKMFFKL